MIIGSFVRMTTQNSTKNRLEKAIKRYLYELYTIGYKKIFLSKAIRKLKHKIGWKPIAAQALKYVRYGL